jgi:hypothetical protein
MKIHCADSLLVLRRVLETVSIQISGTISMAGLGPISGRDPEPIPVQVLAEEISAYGRLANR